MHKRRVCASRPTLFAHDLRLHLKPQQSILNKAMKRKTRAPPQFNPFAYQKVEVKTRLVESDGPLEAPLVKRDTSVTAASR